MSDTFDNLCRADQREDYVCLYERIRFHRVYGIPLVEPPKHGEAGTRRMIGLLPHIYVGHQSDLSGVSLLSLQLTWCSRATSPSAEDYQTTQHHNTTTHHIDRPQHQRNHSELQAGHTSIMSVWSMINSRCKSANRKRYAEYEDS